MEGGGGGHSVKGIAKLIEVCVDTDTSQSCTSLFFLFFFHILFMVKINVMNIERKKIRRKKIARRKKLVTEKRFKKKT